MVETYERLIQSSLRASGCVDLNPLSRTYGSADRAYWHYQDGKGFRVASNSVAMLGLWGAWKLTEKPIFQETAIACLRGWIHEIESGDGALDEYFSGQKSFCATAYAAMSAAVTLQWVSHASEKSVGMNALKKSVQRLVNDHHRPDAANQTLAAMLAFDLAYPNLQNPFSPRTSENGHYLTEYGGFDLGYSLKCLDICALGMSVLSDPKTVQKYKSLSDQLLNRLHTVCVDYTFHPALSSRGNPHRLLGGLSLYTRSGDVRAKETLDTLQHRKRFPDLVDAENSDDKYLCFFHLTSLLLTADVHGEIFKLKLNPVPKPNTNPTAILDESDYLFYRSGSTRAAISKTGTSFYVESDRGRQVLSGWMGKVGNTIWVSAEHDPSRTQVEKRSENEILLTTPLLFRRRKERTALVQSFLFSFALRFVMKLPVLRTFVRNGIYGQSSKKYGAVENWGTRTIRLVGPDVEIYDEFSQDRAEMWLNCGWNMTDGHATRLRGLSDVIFRGPMNLTANKKIPLFPMGNQIP